MARLVCRVRIPEGLNRAFPFVISLLDGLGLSLANPGNSKVTAWNNNGDSVELTAGEVHLTVISGSLRNIQFWRTVSEDVFVAWQNVQGGCTFSFYLDGLDPAFAVLLISRFAESLLTTFRSKCDDGDVLTISFE